MMSWSSYDDMQLEKYKKVKADIASARFSLELLLEWGQLAEEEDVCRSEIAVEALRETEGDLADVLSALETRRAENEL